ncbi:MAG: ATP-binding protein [Prevotella sp.]|jgi:predicted AAA+ superfamily ATPase|nr:ATP-binding protein [Prevotella sp.]
MESLFQKHRVLVSQVNMKIVRQLMNSIDWEKQLVSIRGSRGVGKTTLMRQYIRKTYGVNAGEALYLVMDSMYFTTHSLLDVAERFHLMGGKHLFLDEVHKYPTWSREIKEICDLWPDLKITFTGSSLLQILNADADLSRRVLSYDMTGLSFREYLQFYKGIELPSYPLDKLLSDADEICKQVCEACHPQPLFEEYLRVGYYPFYDGNEQEYYSRIENVVSFIIDQEMTQFCGVEPAYTRKLKAMLLFLANNVPYDVSIAKLSSYLEINKTTVLSYLSSMQRAELLNLLYADNLSVTKMQKPDKVYIHNPNMLYALSTEEKIGTIRECFVVNQLSAKHTVEYGKTQGDFKIDGKITFEVGGKDKSFEQIADIPDSYVLADSMMFPIGKKLPLWIVGFLY